MFEIIENLRAKPERKKKRIAFLISFSFAAIILLIWISVIFPDLTRRERQEENAKNTTPSPASAFSRSMAAGVGDIKQQFKGLIDITSSFSTEPAHFTATSTTDLNYTYSTENE